VQAQVAIQDRGEPHAMSAAASALEGALAEAAPSCVEWASGAGRHGVTDVIAITWSSRTDMDRWLDGPFGELADRFVGPGVGAWFEAIAAPRSHYEANASTQTADWGMSRGRAEVLEPDHAYWGAMRDRIAAAEDDGLPGTLGAIAPQPPRQDGRGAVDVPAGTTFIRTVQGWSAASPAEITAYREDLRDQYVAGVRFLDDHPVDARCLVARLLTDRDPGPGRPDTETIAWFASLADLEQWVHHHPTHQAIYAASQRHAARFGADMRLLLSHEVVVVPPGGARARYVGCDPATGLLAYLPAQA
jgi:phenylacetaldoxime dehydratase/aldoxime dehydratase